MSRRGIIKPADRPFRVPRSTPWQVILPKIPRPRIGGISTGVIIWGFVVLIVTGAALLMLPWSTRSGDIANPVTALFTSTSAICVTGLSSGGYLRLLESLRPGGYLALIQIGGFGFMITATLVLVALDAK